MSTKKLIAGAAMAGLLSGLYATQASAKGSLDLGTSIIKMADKDSCKGKNECKGKGGCKVTAGPTQHECAGKNECKGQGGCNGKMAKKK